MKRTGKPTRVIASLTKRPQLLLAVALTSIGVMLFAAQPTQSASISGPTLLDVTGKYVGGTNGIDGTSWTSLKTDFAYRLGGTAVGKNNRNTPNAAGDTTGTLDPNLNAAGYFRSPVNGTVTISGTFTSALMPDAFSPYGGQFLSVGLINRAWVDNAKSAFNADMRSSSTGANGNAYLLFYKESLGAPVYAALEDHAGGRASATDRRDIGPISSGVITFSIQLQAGRNKDNNPVAIGGRMRYSLNGGAYGPWDNNSHDFVNQDTTLQLTAYTSLGYPLSVTFGSVRTNTAPIANNDTYAVNEDATLTVVLPGVLANDSDPDSDPLVAVLTSGPSNGSLTLNADGAFSYTPNANFNGSDSFVYHASDASGGQSQATVTITVMPVNDAPSASADSYTTNEDTPLSVPAPGVLANDNDIDSDPLSAVLVSGPSSGSLTLNANGSFTYTPNANFNGGDSFSYKARDVNSAESAPVTVTLTVTPVNDAPTASADSYTTNEDTPLSVPASGVLANDSDSDGDPVTAVLVSGPSSGSLTLNADGSFTYTPNANFNGGDSFSYRARDTSAALSTAVTVALTVTPVNDAPSASADSYTTNEDTPLSVPAPGVLTNDSNPDGGSFSAVLVSGPSSGGLTLNANGSFTYTPNANFNGGDSFSYKASDAQGDLSAAVTVALTVTPVNDAPTASADSYTTNEDTPLSVPAAGVLANDSDSDGDPVTAVLTSGPSSGSLTLNADGSFTYTPNANFNGSDSFSYRARDPSAALSTAVTVALTVTPVNDAPSASADSYTTNEDTPLSVPAPGVLANDSNPDGGSFSAVLVSGPSSGGLTLNANGSFTYTPNANFNGGDSFSYKASDAQGDLSAAVTVALTVTPVNDAPTFTKGADQSVNEDAGPQTVGGWATSISPGPIDETSQVLNFLVSNTNSALFSAQPMIAASGSLSYTPAPNANGSATVTVRLHDNGGTAHGGVDTSPPQTFQITVNPVNDPPTANDDSASVAKDSSANTIAVLANDVCSPDMGETMLITAITQGANGVVAIASGGTAVTYQPHAGFTGSDSFTYTLSDGNGGTSIASVTITVSEFKVFLPLFKANGIPDLIGSFSLSSNTPAAGEPVTITATITNQGNAPASQFWVDFYINPTNPPTTTNQPWNKSCGAQACPYGIAWYIADVIAPGQSITITSAPGSYVAKNTIWPGYFASGTTDLYLYVDSWNPTMVIGAVQESNETNNRAERHGLAVSGTSAAPAGPQRNLPERRRSPEE
jgi:VCBS repeat-containing protein